MELSINELRVIKNNLPCNKIDLIGKIHLEIKRKCNEIGSHKVNSIYTRNNVTIIDLIRSVDAITGVEESEGWLIITCNFDELAKEDLVTLFDFRDQNNNASIIFE